MLAETVAAGEFAIAAAAILVLVYVIIDDLRNYRIKNTIVLVLLVLFCCLCLVKQDIGFVFEHVLFGGILFLVLLLMYSLRLMGGGDVKLMAVGFLWFGPGQALLFSLATSAFGLLYSVGARMGLLPARRVNGRLKVPFGPSIALAWILGITLPRLSLSLL